MKTALLIAALALTSSAFAKATKEEKKAAMAACKSEGVTKKEMKSCVKGKLSAGTQAAAAK